MRQKELTKLSPALRPHSLVKTSCDDALALFLIHLAEQVKESFYVMAVKFAVLYRDCLISYRRQTQLEELGQQSRCLASVGDVIDAEAESLLLSAEDLPDICNYFMVNYMSQFTGELWAPEKPDLEQLVESLCEWLWAQNLTSTHLIRQK